jgi:ubiquinone/menaquinone biosynthesis C-methylase UbiE
MQDMEYFYDVFIGLPRGGPGDNTSTRKAFNYLKNLPPNPYILDIGCGHGVQTLELARISKGTIIALDNYQPFLNVLKKNIIKDGLEKRISIKNESMLEMDFQDGTFDVIWSEGALYIMGFQQGVQRCKRLLKDNGYLVVTEAVLFTDDIPLPLKKFWDEMYPVIKDIPGNISLIQHEGFNVITHFHLPKSSWTDKYYIPMAQRLKELRKKYKDNKAALRIFDQFDDEIRIYNKYSDYFGYEFFVMQKQ